MASPQIENGYTKIANELLDALSGVDMSGSAWRIFNVILRKTYGFNKKLDKISLSQFEGKTGLTRMSVTRAIKELEEKFIIVVNRETFINTFSVQKDHTKWGSNNMVTSNKVVTKTSNNMVTETSNRFDTHKRKEIKEKVEQSSTGKKSMKKNTFGKYKENDHGDYEEAVDYDSGEVIVDEGDNKKKAQTDQKKKLVDWLVSHQQRDKRRFNRPNQFKALNRLIDMEVSPKAIVAAIFELEAEDYWKNSTLKPDFNTVVKYFEKRS